MELDQIEKQIKELKEQKKEIKEKYTFKGVYKKFAGRNNIFVDLKNSKMEDKEKVLESIKRAKSYISEIEEKVK